MVYTGEAVTQSLVLTDRASGNVLEEEKDYHIEYANHVKAGKATVTLTGIGRYSGIIRKTYTITKASITEMMVEERIVAAQQDRAGVKPDVTITYRGQLLVNGQDYSLSYTNNKIITTELRKAYITVTGKGNFTGKLKNIVELQISPKSWQSSDITIEVPDMKYSKNRKEYKPVPVVCDNGKKLVKNKDYTITYELNGKDDIGILPETGHTARVIITAIGPDYADGTGNNSRTVTFRIIGRMIGETKVKLVNPQYYSQYGVTPRQEDLSVFYKKEPVDAEEYEIISCSNNMKKGNAVLMIRGRGRYGETKKVTFVIGARGMQTNLADTVSRVISTFMEVFE